MRSSIGIKSWIAKIPSVDEVRPAHCAGCGAASRPVGDRLVLHGHGLLERQVRGVVSLGRAPRRDRAPGARVTHVSCCRAVMTVVPRGHAGSAAVLRPVDRAGAVPVVADGAKRLRAFARRSEPGSYAALARRGWVQLYRWARSVGAAVRVAAPVSGLVGPIKRARSASCSRCCKRSRPPRRQRACRWHSKSSRERRMLQ